MLIILHQLTNNFKIKYYSALKIQKKKIALLFGVTAIHAHLHTPTLIHVTIKN